MDGKTPIPQVLLVSYPRSGNTLLRAYLEKITGLVTGSDCDITKPLNYALYQAGLQGEGIFDARCQVIKSHYPERYNSAAKILIPRAILLVRSPFDCLPSFFNMICTGSH